MTRSFPPVIVFLALLWLGFRAQGGTAPPEPGHSSGVPASSRAAAPSDFPMTPVSPDAVIRAGITDTDKFGMAFTFPGAGGMIWSDVARESGKILWLSHDAASAYCQNIGGRLPEKDDYTRMSRYLGLATLPRLIRYEDGWRYTRFWAENDDPAKPDHCYIFDATTGETFGTTYTSENKEAFRCVNIDIGHLLAENRRLKGLLASRVSEPLTPTPTPTPTPPPQPMPNPEAFACSAWCEVYAGDGPLGEDKRFQAHATGPSRMGAWNNLVGACCRGYEYDSVYCEMYTKGVHSGPKDRANEINACAPN